ncbi:hypothetical protein Poli38472_006813 [Pythium oligandrum]|uniref:tryptophan synthase n=1 Tax=Pythium oligandrum TaxID=41045 RepID=A0A8K1FFH2_PYTOL|nr:hypothetical protein Poli38472_006813 [Pythium oligandrum]|eukprot:TMW56803.1 hypothetical protein Poli38472_006813 [Pythium oligandrum]
MNRKTLMQTGANIIERAHRIGISQGISLRDVLSIVWEARKMGLSVPVVLMVYSSVLNIGSDKLCVEAKKAGVVGFIIVGVSSEDAKTLTNASKKHDLAFIPLIFPTTPEGQMREIGALAHGFVYCVSHNGVTGIRPELPANLSSFMAKVRRHISLPLALGFGMATRRHFLQAGVVADGVVMSSKIIKTIDESPNDTASRTANVEKFCQSVVFGK